MKKAAPSSAVKNQILEGVRNYSDVIKQVNQQIKPAIEVHTFLVYSNKMAYISTLCKSKSGTNNPNKYKEIFNYNSRS